MMISQADRSDSEVESCFLSSIQRKKKLDEAKYWKTEKCYKCYGNLANVQFDTKLLPTEP